MNRSQSVQQVKSLDRSARAVGCRSTCRTSAGRPVRSTMREASIPRTPRCQAGSSRMMQSARNASLGIAQSLQLNLDGRKRAGFGGAPFVVQSVELLRQRKGAVGLASEKQLDDVAGNVHSACRIDARSQPVTFVAVGARFAGIWATCIRARKPGCTGFRSSRSPSAAITRFSPSSGTESAIVAMATSFKREAAPSSAVSAAPRSRPRPAKWRGPS